MKYVLSLDGGGIRGIIPAVVLQEIENRTGKKISEMFDLISGTSTGGILALGLTKKDDNGKIQYSANALLNLYLENGGKIFESKFSHKCGSWNGIIGPKFPHKNIEKILKEYFNQTKMGDAMVPTMVTTYDIEGRQPYFLKSWSDENKKVLIKEAARATSAAPTYFSPALVNVYEDEGTKKISKALVDGGVFINNPAVSAYAEAKRIFNTDEIVVVSIGTGQLTRPYHHKKTRSWGALKWIKPLLDCMFDGVSDATDYQMGYFLSKDRFFRLQVELNNANDDMDDASTENMKKLQGEANRLIQRQKKDIDKIVQLLSSKTR